MAGHSACDERSLDADEQASHAAADPATRAALQAALHGHIARGAIADARAAADRIAAHDGLPGGMALLVDVALAMGQVQIARIALAESDAGMTPVEAALLRARIALAEGDPVAARAILIAAIEAVPDDPAPRRALAEVMVATGTAADARTVLAHLGATPGAKPAA